MKLNTSGLGRPSSFAAIGVKLKAYSSNGSGDVTSYIGTRKGKRVYGSYDYQKGKYIEKDAPRR